MWHFPWHKKWKTEQPNHRNYSYIIWGIFSNSMSIWRILPQNHPNEFLVFFHREQHCDPGPLTHPTTQLPLKPPFSLFLFCPIDHGNLENYLDCHIILLYYHCEVFSTLTWTLSDILKYLFAYCNISRENVTTTWRHVCRLARGLHPSGKIRSKLLV